MKLKICAFSDDRKFIAYLDKFFSSIVDIVIKVKYFSNLVEFYEYKDKSHFDIILIDIDSIEYNSLGSLGMTYLGNASVCMLCNKSLFEYDPYIWASTNKLTIILKKYLKSELLGIIQDKAFKLRSCSLTVKADNTIYRFYYSEIMVIDPIGHYLDFYVLNYPDPIKTRMQINTITDDLLQNHFVVVKDSTYVNCDYIKVIDKNTKKIILENDMNLNYSRRRYKAIKQKVMEGK